MKNVLLVSSLKNNLLSISTLKYQGYNVAFVNGQVLTWHKKLSIEKATLIGVREEGIYRLNGHPEKVVVHNNVSSS